MLFQCGFVLNLQNVYDLRKSGWKSRRSVNAARFIEQSTLDDAVSSKVAKRTAAEMSGDVGMPQASKKMKIEVNLFEQIELTDSDVEVRTELLQNIKRCLRKKFPVCQLYPFGSFLSGIGDKDSDLDVIYDGTWR